MGDIFNPRIYIADFGPLKRAFFGRFPKMQYNFLKMRGGIAGRLEISRKFIQFGSATLPSAANRLLALFTLLPLITGVAHL